MNSDSLKFSFWYCQIVIVIEVIDTGVTGQNYQDKGQNTTHDMEFRIALEYTNYNLIQYC